MKEKFKHCPWCGCEAISFEVIDIDSFVKPIEVTCNDCQATREARIDVRNYDVYGPAKYSRDLFDTHVIEKALRCWNTRIKL